MRLIDSCTTQLKAQGPSRTCDESKEEEEEDLQIGVGKRHQRFRPSWSQDGRLTETLPERAICFLSGTVEEAGADSLFVDLSPDGLDSLAITVQAGDGGWLGGEQRFRITMYTWRRDSETSSIFSCPTVHSQHHDSGAPSCPAQVRTGTYLSSAETGGSFIPSSFATPDATRK